MPFGRMPAATGTSDWSGMNLDLYNFHLRTSPIVTSQPSPAPSSTMISASWVAAGLAASFSPPGMLALATWIYHRPRAIVSMTTFQKPHFQFSMLLLMPLLWVLWQVAGELLAITSSENVTLRFCNNFAIIQSLYTCKMCSNYPGIKLEPALLSHLTPVSI